MTDDIEKLLAVYEVRLHDFLSLCDLQKSTIEGLTHQLKTHEESIQRAEQEIRVLNAKYTDLLTAHIISSEERDVKKARLRLLKLVREVEKSIALLNG